jgi:hypothetical protein
MRIVSFLLLFCLLSELSAQSGWMQKLHQYYPQCQENSITTRRFKHADLVPILQDLPSPFLVQEEGKSVEGRAIYRVSIGQGPTKVLLWSQMHGDEPTATAAILDIFRFLQASGDEFDAFRRQLLAELTIVFIPMLNPDGAEKFQRRNALGIDLNRDALRLTSPEAQLLKRVRDELQADWGFNLHDQSRYYGAGYPSENVATLSFLAPAYDFDKNINPGRERAMQVIAQISKELQAFIPGRVARYNDAFEPRAFGDNMQKWGTSTILIESGGYPDDREKQYIRKLNFASMLTALHSIAKGTYQQTNRTAYNQIPYNKGGLFNDLLLRQVYYKFQGQSYLMDIAFNRSENDYNGARDFYYRGRIDDVGDLSYQQGYQVLDSNHYTVEIAKLYPELLADMDAVRAIDSQRMLREGYGVVRMLKATAGWRYDNDPLLVIGVDGIYDQTIAPGLNPPLIVRDQSGIVRYAVINGRLVQLD